MERTYYIELWKYGKPRELHSFNMEVCGKGWYWAVTSYSAFTRREIKRFSNLLEKHGGYTEAFKNMPRYASSKSERDIRFEEQIGMNLPSAYPPLQHHHHSSIWSLYQAIGYDYKKKKWVNK